MNKETIVLHGREEIEKFYRDHWEVHSSRNEEEFQALIDQTMNLKDGTLVGFPTEYYVNGVPVSLDFEVKSIQIHHNPCPDIEGNLNVKMCSKY